MYESKKYITPKDIKRLFASYQPLNIFHSSLLYFQRNVTLIELYLFRLNGDYNLYI